MLISIYEGLCIQKKLSGSFWLAEIQLGRLRQKVEIINEVGRKVGVIHQIQENGKPIDEAAKGEQVAVSIKEISVGRQINEGDVFFTDLNSKEAKLLSERFMHRLNEKKRIYWLR